jgi:outer membrane lipoprotein-sorting protein
MKRLKLALFLLVSLAATLRGEEAAAPAPADIIRAKEAFDGVNGRIDRLASLQYKVVRKTKAKGISLTEHWTFGCNSQGWMRVEYTAPEKRVFMIDGTNLLEYLPDARRALRTPLGGAGAARVAAVLKRLAVDGLRVGQTDELLKHLKAAAPLPGEPSVLMIEGDQPRYAIRIDPARQVLLGFDQWNLEGEKTLSIQADDFTEPAPGFWFPARIRMVVVDKGERQERKFVLSGIRVNAAFSKDYFDFTLPDDVKMEAAEPSAGVLKPNTR